MMTDRHTHTHTPMPTVDLTCAQTHSHISGRFFYSTPRSTSWHTHTHTHTSSYELEICLTMTHTYTHSYPRLVALQNTYFSSTFTEAFLFHALRRYTQLAYLFHQCATSFLSRDSRIADCTKRHPGVERPFSSLKWAICEVDTILKHFLVKSRALWFFCNTTPYHCNRTFSVNQEWIVSINTEGSI